MDFNKKLCVCFSSDPSCQTHIYKLVLRLDKAPWRGLLFHDLLNQQIAHFVGWSYCPHLLRSSFAMWLHKQLTLVFVKDNCVHMIWTDYKKPLGGNNSPTKFPGFSFRPSSCLSSSTCCLSHCYPLWQIIFCSYVFYWYI